MIWYELNDAFAAHGYALILDGGAEGVRDLGLLESALNRPKNANHDEGEKDVIRLATFYVAGIALNHPFVDGNKRAAFLVGVAFIEINGFYFHAPQAETAVTIEALAGKQIDQEQLEAFFRKYSTAK